MYIYTYKPKLGPQKEPVIKTTIRGTLRACASRRPIVGNRIANIKPENKRTVSYAKMSISLLFKKTWQNQLPLIDAIKKCMEFLYFG